MAVERHLRVVLADPQRALARLCALLAHRGPEVLRLTFDQDPLNGRGYLLLSVRVRSEADLDMLVKRLNRATTVVKVVRVETIERVRAAILVDILCDDAKRGELLTLLVSRDAEIVHVTSAGIIAFFAGSPDRVADLLDVLGQYDVREVVRSGLLGIPPPQAETQPLHAMRSVLA